MRHGRTPSGTRVDLEPIPAAVWKVACVLVAGGFVASLDTSLVNVGLDTVGRDLRAPLTAVQWVTSGYLIALAAALPACAWLGRRVGSGRLWLWALIGFTAASGLCAVAPNLAALVVLRVLQGAAGGLLIPAGQTVLGQLAGPTRMGRVMNTVGVAPLVLAPALGPALGGLVISSVSWRALFVVNLPVGAAALAVGARIIPRGRPTVAGRLDLVGLVLAGGGLPLIVYGVTAAASQRGAASPSAVVALFTGIVALVTFAMRCGRRADPLLNVRMFAHRVYAAAQAAVLFTGASLYGGLVIVPLYYEQFRHLGVVATGLLLLPYGAGAGLSMRAGGWLTDRFGGGIVATGGLAVCVATTAPFAVLGPHAGMTLVEALQLGRGVGIGLAGVPPMSAAYATVPADLLHDATAQTNIVQRVGGALGTALLVVALEDGSTPGAKAFHTTFAWLAAISAVAAIAAAWLAVTQRRERLARSAPSPCGGLTR